MDYTITITKTVIVTLTVLGIALLAGVVFFVGATWYSGHQAARKADSQTYLSCVRANIASPTTTVCRH